MLVGGGNFTIGDATVNGTAGIIMAGGDVIIDTSEIKGSYTLGNIKINTFTTINDDPTLKEIKRRVQKSYVEAFKPIGIDLVARQALDGTGIPALVLYLPELKRLWASKELAVEAAYKDPKLNSYALIVATSVFWDIKRILTASSNLNVKDRAQIAYILATVSHESQFGVVGAYPSSVTHNPMYEYSGGTIGSDYDFQYFSRLYDGRGKGDLGNRERGEGDGFRYRGRGYVQFTGKANYEKFQNILGVDITATQNPTKVRRPVKYSPIPRFLTFYNDNKTINDVTKYSDESDPDKVANDKDLAAKITVLGMRDGLFTGVGFSSSATAVSELNPNFYEARAIINGDKGNREDPNDKLRIGESISKTAYMYLDVLTKKVKY